MPSTPGIRPAVGAAATHVIEICSTIIGADIAPGTDLFTCGLTSLNLVRLVGAFERDLGVRLTTLDIYDHPTADGLTALIEGRRAPEPDELSRRGKRASSAPRTSTATQLAA